MKGKYNRKKCTYQSRYNNTYNLLRIDINGPPHDNPDCGSVECPHIHIYLTLTLLRDILTIFLKHLLHACMMVL